MKKSWYSFRAASPEVAELSVFDEIGFWGVQAKDFVAQVKAITAPTIKLFINSPGGSVFDAVTMFNALAMSGKTIEVHVLGIAASAASYLAMVGNKVTMPDNTMMFLHNPINGVYGNAEDMREMADVLDKIGASLTATYAKRFKGDEKALTDILAAESYLTAAECLEYGLCDEVVPAIEAVARFDLDAAEVPEAVRARVFKAAAPAPAPTPAPLSAAIRSALEAVGLAAYAPVFAADVTLDDEAKVAAAVAEAVEIVALCDMTKMPDRAEALIRARTPLAAARKSLADALAAAADALPVDTAPRSDPTAEPSRKPAKTFTNSSELWAEINAMQRSAK